MSGFFVMHLLPVRRRGAEMLLWLRRLLQLSQGNVGVSANLYSMIYPLLAVRAAPRDESPVLTPQHGCAGPERGSGRALGLGCQGSGLRGQVSGVRCQVG